MSERPAIHLTCSSGGHMDLMRAIRGAFDGYRCVWVAQPSLHGKTLAADGDLVYPLPRYDRTLLSRNTLRNLRQAIRVVLRERPSVVVTTGAGVTVPLCVFARLAGAKVIFVETMARITGPSASGRVLSRVASRTLVQWPEAQAAYPRARLCQPELLKDVSTERHAPLQGTFVALGTHSQQFDRLLAMVDEAAGRGVLPQPILAQAGVSTYQPRNYRRTDWLSPEEMQEAIGGAECIVCHAGSGVISSALRVGRRPLVLARLAEHDEHFDDHQTQIATKLGELGLVVSLEEAITEADVLVGQEPLSELEEADQTPSVEAALESELRALTG